MATLIPHSRTKPPVEPPPRQLLPGDRLDQETFHALYEAEPPDGPKFELIGGMVYVSPLYPAHGVPHAEIIGWLARYKTQTPGVEALDNTTMILADDSEPQPDACLILEPARGGKTGRKGKYMAGPAELVVEVAYSSVAYDLHAKKADYERLGVQEYVVVVLREPRVVWFARRGERFEEIEPGENGWFRSEAFPGLWLDPDALLRRDSAAVAAALDQGLSSPEHSEFVERLSR